MVNRSDECAGAMMRRKETTMSTEITTTSESATVVTENAIGLGILEVADLRC